MSDECILHHKRLLNPELQPFMNVTMVLPGEKEKVYALRNVLEIRCPALLNDEGLIKKKKEKKGDAGLITVDYKAGLMSHAVLLQVLEWVYTDAIDVESLSILELLQLLKASRLFDAPRLVFLCEYELRRKLTVDSVFTVLKEASQLGMEPTKSLATSFAHQNWPQFCAHKGGMDIIGLELFQELTVAMQFYKPDEKIDTSPAALQEVPSTLVRDYKKMLVEGRFSDGEFLFPKEGAEGIRFHRAIVAAHSRPLFQLISAGKSKQYTLEGVGHVAAKDLLEYIYFYDDNFDPTGACQLVEHVINQFALQHMLEDCIASISDGITDAGALPILRVTYLPNFEQGAPIRELREKALNHICRQFKSIAIPDLREVQPANIGNAMTADILDKVYTSFPMSADDAQANELRKSKKKKKTHRTSRTPREGKTPRSGSKRDLSSSEA